MKKICLILSVVLMLTFTACSNKTDVDFTEGNDKIKTEKATSQEDIMNIDPVGRTAEKSRGG